jgi:mono/diheme cytochrome c family protein
MTLATAASFANVYRTIGLTLAVLVVLAALVYVIVNFFFAGKAELGSEIELAPNRKPYYDDERLEGEKLNRSLTFGLILVFICAAGIPAYWVMEPGRQENAAEGFGTKFINRGEALYSEASDEHPRGLGCATCHGGTAGGVREDHVLTDPATGEVTLVDWRAPATNTVLLRYSREEVLFILTYGRPGSPMPAWGVAGGGALNDQQLQNLVDYLESVQLSPEEAQAQAEEAVETYRNAIFEDDEEPVFGSDGEILFNLGLLDNFAGGAYSCARCHTAGWSYADPPLALDDEGNPITGDDGEIVVDREAFEAITEFSGCGGAFGPNLCDGVTERQFPDETDHADFVAAGSENGIGYGQRGQGTGKMPGFSQRPAEDALFWIDGGAARDPGPGMLTFEQVEEIVAYERALEAGGR